jgi:hypothetical protein
MRNYCIMKRTTLIPLFGLLLTLSCVKDKTNNEIPEPPGELQEKTDSARLIFINSRSFPSGKSVNSLTAFLPTGAIKWQRNDMGTSGPQRSYYYNGILFYTPSVFGTDSAGNYVYTAGFNVMYFATGVDSWRLRSSTEIYSSLIARNDSLFCFMSHKHLTIFNIKNARRLLMHPVPGEYGGSDITFDTEGNYLYFVTNETSTTSYLNRFNLTTKTIVWKTPLGINISQTYSRPLVTKDKIYLKNGTGGLMAVNKTDGTVSWAVGGSLASPVLGNNLIYTVLPGKGLVALNAQTGKPEWEWTVPGLYYSNASSIQLAGNKIIVASGSNSIGTFIASVNATTGKENWVKPIPYYFQSSAAVGNYLYGLQVGLANGVYMSRIMTLNTQTQIMKDSFTLTGEEIGGFGVLTWAGDFLGN